MGFLSPLLQAIVVDMQASVLITGDTRNISEYGWVDGSCMKYFYSISRVDIEGNLFLVFFLAFLAYFGGVHVVCVFMCMYNV